VLTLETLEVTIVCTQEQSLKVPQILDQIEKEHKGISYTIEDSFSFAPVFDETTIKIVLSAIQISTITAVPILTSLMERLHKNDMRTEYNDRYKLAIRTLEDKAPLICEQMEDTPFFSQYKFITKYGKYVWTYNKGKISMSQIDGEKID
jgi:hypothetical protein